MKPLPIILAALAFAASFALARALQGPGGPLPEPAGALDVLFDGPDLFVDLDVRAADLVGFAHAPSTPAEHAAMARGLRLLDAGELLVPSPAARCSLDQSFATLGFGYDDLCSTVTGGAHVVPAGGPDGATTPGPRPDVAARWSWVCDAPERLERVEVRLFDAFDGVGALDVRLAGPAGDARAGLVPGRSAIALAPVR